jgi:hypothetical protein
VNEHKRLPLARDEAAQARAPSFGEALLEAGQL